jgi:pimeloyl-ACP methyl ester carboxylesterase
VTQLQILAGAGTRNGGHAGKPASPHWHAVRRGSGRPILLLHGLGGNRRLWRLIVDSLAMEREVIAIDLPGFGGTPALTGQSSIQHMADALTQYLRANGLIGIDAVGSCMGARLLLELVRRDGVLGTVVAIAPGGFWQGWERGVFFVSMFLYHRLLRLMQPLFPFIAGHAWARALMLAQLSAHPRRLPAQLVLEELRSRAASTSFDQLLYDLAFGQVPQGAAAGSIRTKLVIGWGRRDRVCLARQAQRVLALFPDAQLHWFDDSGHFPQWDTPQQIVRLILEHTAGLTLAVAPPAQPRVTPSLHSLPDDSPGFAVPHPPPSAL